MALIYLDNNPLCPLHPEAQLPGGENGIWLHEPDWSTAALGDCHVSVRCLHCGAEGGVTLEPEEFSWAEPKVRENEACP